MILIDICCKYYNLIKQIIINIWKTHIIIYSFIFIFLSLKLISVVAFFNPDRIIYIKNVIYKGCSSQQRMNPCQMHLATWIEFGSEIISKTYLYHSFNKQRSFFINNCYMHCVLWSWKFNIAHENKKIQYPGTTSFRHHKHLKWIFIIN